MSLQTTVEKYLTWREKRKLKKQLRQEKKHPVLDWVEAIVTALLLVVLIQQFLFELYIIPTGSMIPTIDIGTRIVVDKYTYGPELIPGEMKLQGRKPERGDVIMFESPVYPSMGPLKNILHKILYRLTLTMVDIDRDANGNPKPRLLLKRLIGTAGDRIRMSNGNVEIRPAGMDYWYTEEEIKGFIKKKYPIRRVVDPALPLDHFSRQKERYKQAYERNPYDQEARNNWRQADIGWYIPHGYLFPMGDNRDNSLDARIYGPVKIKRLLGKGIFRLWPFNRFGSVE